MIAALTRIIFGLIVACLTAGLVQTLFVVTPFDLASADAVPESLANAGLLSLFAATHSAVFGTPFAVIAALLGEWQHVRQLLYYALIGIIIAMAGLFFLHMSEVGGLTILNPYALIAYFTTGLLAGFVYWLIAGQFAGNRTVWTMRSSEHSA